MTEYIIRIDDVLYKCGVVDRLIRCGECELYKEGSNGVKGYCEKYNFTFAPWDFCSRAKGKSNE